MDGANQIVTPAFVSLLCICIVFVPMFFLHRRGALPVRADGRSRDVRDDLVVHPVAHAGADDGEISAAAACASCRRRRAAAVAQSAGAVPARFRGAVRALARRLPRSAVAGDATAAGFRDRIPRPRRGVVPAGAVPRPELLSLGRCRLDPDACPHPGRHPRRGKRQPVRRRAEGDPQDHSARRDRHAGRQHRHADQRHQHDLQQHRRDRPAGRRYPDQAERGPPPDRRICSGAARTACRALFPA